MTKKDYTGLLYVFTSLTAFFIFSAMFIDYLFNKEIKIYLIVIGFFTLAAGFVLRKGL